MDNTDARYAEVSEEFGVILRRLARGYETDPERRLDLLQEIHIELGWELGDRKVRSRMIELQRDYCRFDFLLGLLIPVSA